MELRNFLNVHDVIESTLQNNDAINTVTYGDLNKVDIKKQTIFANAHFYINSFVVDNQTREYNMTLILSDLLDVNKDTGQDNEKYIHNTFVEVAANLFAKLGHGDLFEDGYQLQGVSNGEPFIDRYQNVLAGVEWTFTIITKNQFKIC